MRAHRHTKAIDYVRVSCEQQASEGVSSDAQKHKLRDYCRAMDIELLDIIADEGYSASTLKRPGLQVALSMLKRGQAHSLIVVKLDPTKQMLDCLALWSYRPGNESALNTICGQPLFDCALTQPKCH